MITATFPPAPKGRMAQGIPADSLPNRGTLSFRNDKLRRSSSTPSPQNQKPVRGNLSLRNDKFILKREARAQRPQFDTEHPRWSRGIRHCAMINCPKPTLGRHVAQQREFVVT
jgi:hypothetical protein